MIHDFWNVVERNLYLEIAALKTRVDPLTWKAIEAVRTLGNIGSHMEAEPGFIIDVDAHEASMLLDLVEILIKDWYIARHDREQSLQRLAEAAQQKAAGRRLTQL